MSTEQIPHTQSSPGRSVDAHGRVIPRTEEEQRRHVERALRILDEIATIGDLDEQTATLDMLLKALDEEPL
jgi:hypothetical protein